VNQAGIGRTSAPDARRVRRAAGVQALTAMLSGRMNVALRDASGGASNISTGDVLRSNGVIHVTDQVLLPKM